mgnify:CR=1 FL=1
MSQNNVPTSEINVGIIPIGTGNDWIKTHNIPLNLEGAVQKIKNGSLATQDIGKLVIQHEAPDHEAAAEGALDRRGHAHRIAVPVNHRQV